MKLDQNFVRTLERLNILARRIMLANVAGQRTSKRKGASIEFYDYRHYSPGDEIRYIDWNIYARHSSLFIKEFAAEEAVHVALAIDTSLSMTYGSPSKLDAARLLAASLGYIGLANFDAVSLLTFSDRLAARKAFLMGKGRIFELMEALEHVAPEGRTDLRSAMQLSLPRLKGRTVLILLTDFYDIENYREALKQLLAQRVQVHAVQVLSEEEISPKLDGRLVLQDLETGQERELYISPEAVDLYRRRVQKFLEELQKTCQDLEIRYARALSKEPLEEVIVRIVQTGILEVK